MKLRHSPTDGSQQELFRPTSDWTPPTGPLPALSGAVVAIDTETRDEGLSRGIGPGWVYDLGHLCGVSVAWADRSMYVPMRHPDTECRPVGEVIEWVEGILRNCEVHFFNAGYDLAWLWREGCRVWPERMHDGYVSSVMLDENHDSYSLDNCCARAGIPGKNPRLLEEAARALGVHPKSGLWQMPARYVGPYAEQDAVSTLRLSQRQIPLMQEQGITGAYQTEVDLVRVLYEMRRRGIRVNEDKAEDACRRIGERRDRALEEIRRISGFRVDMRAIRSPEAIGKIMLAAGVECPRTPKTNLPSVTRQWLASLDHPIGHHVRSARRFEDLAEKFLRGYILGNVHRGRIYAEVHQLRDDDGGTRTYRLSYSNPPLQQTPARPDRDDPQEDRDLVREVRSCLEPEDGEKWAALDYAGQEPRILVHLAAACEMPGGEEMAQRYRNDPALDYHSTVAAILGWPRAQAKDTNQGLAYGMGRDKLARTLGCTLEEADEKLEVYHGGMPYVQALTDHCSNMARSRGWIRLVDGARCHFETWQPSGSRRKEDTEKSLEAARLRWPHARLERAFTYRALNRACQGGAARQMKRAMVECHRAGLPPLVQMHDELGFSITSKREAETAQQCMLDAVRLCVPMMVDVECGPDWGNAKKTLAECGL